MGIDITEYEKLSTEEEWVKFNKWFYAEYPNIHFEFENKTYNLLNGGIQEMKINHWKNEFNWKMMSLAVNYQKVYKYLEEMKKIEKKGYSGDEYWCHFYLESLFVRIIGAFDLLYKVIDANYNLRVKDSSKYNIEVNKKLHKKNPKLHRFMVKIHRNSSYKTANAYRISFVHGSPPTNLSLGIKESENKISISKGEIVPNEKLINAINEALKYLEICVKEISKHF